MHRPKAVCHCVCVCVGGGGGLCGGGASMRACVHVCVGGRGVQDSCGKCSVGGITDA